jgi:hypothetical protein
VDPRRLRLSLIALQLVALATLLRSVAYDRWITVVASILLLVGAAAAKRGRVWGIALSLGAAAAFPVAWMIGIAPPWFCLVGLAGALPFAIASKAFARFDRSATVLLAIVAATTGAFGAIAWREAAWSIFTKFPSTLPSVEAQHGLLLAALVASALVAMRLGRRNITGESHGAEASLGEESRVRIAKHVRVGAASDTRDGALAEHTATDETDDAALYAPPPQQRRAKR